MLVDLRKVNLNLLWHLNILLDECSVSKAAKKSFLTQTAMSNILKQLRDIFLDELFIREGNEFKPTAFALTLHPKVKEVLQNIEQLLISDKFNPQTDSITYNVAFSNHGEYLILPKLNAYLTQFAPNISLRVLPLTSSEDIAANLANNIHVAIAPQFYNATHNLIRQSLFYEELRCFMHENHPLCAHELTLKKYLKEAHVAVILNKNEQQTFVDKLLSEHNAQRQVKLYVPNIMSAIYNLCKSNLIGTFPHRLTTLLAGKQAIYPHRVPFQYTPQSIDVIYHRRYMTHPPILWLVDLIQRVTQEALSDIKNDDNPYHKY